MTDPRGAHHLILIRERDAQTASSGCCGALDGDAVRWTASGESVFPERRRSMERIGAVYRAVRRRFADRVRISVVDPRDAIVLGTLLLRDMRRFDVPWRRALRSACDIGATTIVLDGEVLLSGEIPDADDVVRRIAEVVGPERRPVHA